MAFDSGQISITYLLFLISLGLAAQAPLQAHPPTPSISAAQVQVPADYDRLMQQGYTATARRDYRSALIYFRQAEQLRPGSHFATLAIRNISTYLTRTSPQPQSFVPANTGAPDYRVGGSTRTVAECLDGQSCIVALLPNRSQGSLSTSSDNPTLLFYIAPTSAQTMEFRLLSADRASYMIQMAAPSTGGIVSISLSTLKNPQGKFLPLLALGQTYQWSFALMMNHPDCSQSPPDRSRDAFVNGTIQRTDLDPILAKTLQNLPTRDRIPLYTANNLWYDAFATLFQARHSEVTDAQLEEDWTALLVLAGLEQLASKPLLPCCRPR